MRNKTKLFIFLAGFVICSIIIIIILHSKVNNHKANYSISIVSYMENNSYIEYPQIKGLKDNKKQESINKLLEEQVLFGAKYYTREPLVDFSNPNFKYEYKCGIGFANKYISSFWYEFNELEYRDDKIIGDTYRFFCITIDMETGKIIALPDLMAIDERLINSSDGDPTEPDYNSAANPVYHKFKDAFMIYTSEEERDDFHRFTVEKIIEWLSDKEAETRWYIDENREINFYFMNNFIGIPYTEVLDAIYPKYQSALKKGMDE